MSRCTPRHLCAHMCARTRSLIYEGYYFVIARNKAHTCDLSYIACARVRLIASVRLGSCQPSIAFILALWGRNKSYHIDLFGLSARMLYPVAH